jgi:SAM-dependent methyltransferase
MGRKSGLINLKDGEANPRDFPQKSVFFPAVLTSMAIVAITVSSPVTGQDLDSQFTQGSGAAFAEKSQTFDIGYEATPMPVVRSMLKLASVGPKDFVIDLGSGDGRIVITAAKEFRARGFGVDLNQDLVELSRKYAEKNGVAQRTSFSVKDLFMTDLSKADVVTMYLHPEVNMKLRPKLWDDLRPGTRVVSHDFHMGDWRPDEFMIIDIARVDRDDSILYLWIMPARISGAWQWCIPMLGGEQNFSVDFNQHFQDIGGVATNQKGKWRLFDATLRGNRIAFSLVSEAHHRMIRQDYEGRVKGNVIEGSVTLSGGMEKTTFEWRASRTAAGG